MDINLGSKNKDFNRSLSSWTGNGSLFIETRSPKRSRGSCSCATLFIVPLTLIMGCAYELNSSSTHPQNTLWKLHIRDINYKPPPGRKRRRNSNVARGRRVSRKSPSNCVFLRWVGGDAPCRSLYSLTTHSYGRQ